MASEYFENDRIIYGNKTFVNEKETLCNQLKTNSIFGGCIKFLKRIKTVLKNRDTFVRLSCLVLYKSCQIYKKLI